MRVWYGIPSATARFLIFPKVNVNFELPFSE